MKNRKIDIIELIIHIIAIILFSSLILSVTGGRNFFGLGGIFPISFAFVVLLMNIGRKMVSSRFFNCVFTSLEFAANLLTLIFIFIVIFIMIDRDPANFLAFGLFYLLIPIVGLMALARGVIVGLIRSFKKSR